MRVLVACEFSGIVRDAFICHGHDAVSCDLLPSERPGPHIQNNVLRYLADDWDLMIAHPPCTYLCYSGVRWLYTEPGRWEHLRLSAKFFRALMDAPIKRIAIENPVPHRYALEIIGRKYDQLVQPWWFGDGVTKATCLWLKNLPPLLASVISTGREQSCHKMGPSKHRQADRSRTYRGFAEAMATQWGSL